MAVTIHGETLTEAWLADLEHLRAYGDQLNLITTITNPDPALADQRVIDELDNWLLRKGHQRVETVANTVFPFAFVRGTGSREELYSRYLKLLPRLKKQKGNGQGTYFSRLISYPASSGARRGPIINQIEVLIEKLEKQLRSKGPKRFIYQAQIYVPGIDERSTMGFPCLSFLSFQLDGNRLCLTASYRNHFYFQKALGNFMGLANLQRFVAEALNLDLGSLTVHACHAEIDIRSKSEVDRLIRGCRNELHSDVFPQEQIDAAA